MCIVPAGSGDGGRKPTFIFVSNARGCFVIAKKLNDLCEGYGLGIRYESSRKFLSLEMKMEDKMYFGLPCEVLLNLRISVSWIPHTNIHENPSTGSRDTGESIR
jgi:hypothetical protein